MSNEPDLDRFTTAEEKKLLRALEAKLSSLMYWELMNMFNRFITEMDHQEKKVDSITEDVTDIVVKARELFNKWDQFK